jgi:hypothetical protein
MSSQNVRNKLNALFEVEKYGKGAFYKEAGTTNKSLNTVLGMSGSKGRQASTFDAGWKFFKLRQMREKTAKVAIPAVSKKRKSTDGRLMRLLRRLRRRLRHLMLIFQRCTSQTKKTIAWKSMVRLFPHPLPYC